MNSRLLFVATVAVSVLASLAVVSGAVAAPLTDVLAGADHAGAVASAPTQTWSHALLMRSPSA